MNRANYTIVGDTPEQLIIRDESPWERHATVTNDAEQVVKDLAPKLGKRRLLYIDSLGDLDEIVHRDGKFVGFSGGPR
jgi:hypothetical protein